MINKKSIFLFCVVILFLLPLIQAGNFGAGNFGKGLFGIGEVPVTASPSGGGGGSSSCTDDWQCTSWIPSICPELEIQERLCINKGTCTGTTGMPIQNQTCEYLGPQEPLFDIFLTLSDSYEEICAGSRIKANVKLENYAKVELLDAFMTYWVVDENNKLIVELKDTRAVEKKTSFNIETKIPKSTTEGVYRLYSQITYNGNKTAIAGKSFEVLSDENCKLFSQINFDLKYLVYGLIGIVILLFVLVLVKIIKFKLKIIKKGSKGTKTNKEYKSKIKKNLKKIEGKHLFLMIITLLIGGIFFISKERISGLVIENAVIGKSGGNIFGFLLLMGVLSLLTFIYRNRVKEFIEKVKTKALPNSLRGLIQKKVYTEEGEYIGKVEKIFLAGNKIDSLKIRLDKKKKFKARGIIISYKNIGDIDDIVLIEKRVMEKINNH